jgi:hypothetical protein
MSDYVHIAGDARRHHSRRHSLYGASDVRVKIRNQFGKNGLQTRVENFSTEKSGIILKFFRVFTASICLRHVAPLSDATLT